MLYALYNLNIILDNIILKHFFKCSHVIFDIKTCQTIFLQDVSHQSITWKIVKHYLFRFRFFLINWIDIRKNKQNTKMLISFLVFQIQSLIVSIDNISMRN